MIVCHCMNISEDEIRRAVDWMRASDPDTLVTPGKVYRALGKKADCGGCLPLFMNTLEAHPATGVPVHLRELRKPKAARRST